MVPPLVDSHAHLSMEDFDEDRDQVIMRAFQMGVKAILCPADLSEPQSVAVTLDLTEKYKNVVAAAGVHPHNARLFHPEYIQEIENLALAKKIRAIGEIGLDFHYNFSSPEAQKEALRIQLHTAEKLGLSIILHSRNSGREIVESIKNEHFTKGGVVHCFTESWETARKMMDQGFYISFSGIITFPKAHTLRETARKIPLERLLTETDSPFLLPFAYRSKKKRNEPAHVAEVFRKLAEIKDVAPEDLAVIIQNNFRALFLFEI